MRFAALFLALLIPAIGWAQNYPSPIYQNLTVNGTITGPAVGPASTQIAPGCSTAPNATTCRSAAATQGDVVNVKSWGAKGDAVTLTDAAISSGGSALSSASATFTAADVGKYIDLATQGATMPVQAGTITGYTDAHHVTVSFNATAALPGVTVASAAPATGQSGSGSYFPGDTLTVSGGTSATTAALLKIATTQLVSATANATGSGGTNGACVLTGTTGLGALFQISATISGGSISAIGSITTAGAYSSPPASFTAEPVTSNCGLTGATLALKMGPASAIVITPGLYGALPSSPAATTTSGSGTGATLTLTGATSSVARYGTDDTAAWANAAAAIPAAGGTLYCPGGAYLVAGTTTLPSNSTVRGDGCTIIAEASSAWPSGILSSAFQATSQTHITVQNMAFKWPYGSYVYTPYSPHVLNFTSSFDIKVLANTSDGAGDFLASVGSTGVLSQGNAVTNAINACFDHWNGSIEVRVLGNGCSMWNGLGGSAGGIQFTGINTVGGGATSAGFVAADNIVTIQGGSGNQGIIVNGPGSGGYDNQILIHHNRLYSLNGGYNWGILINGIANNGIVDDNYCEGNSGAYSCVGVFSPAKGFAVHDNRAVNWAAGGNGVFANSSPQGSLVGNVGLSSSSPLLGAVDTTTLEYGNDTGTGSLSALNATIGALTVTTVNFLNGIIDIYAPTWGWNGSGPLSEVINAASGNYKLIQTQTAGNAHWFFGQNADAESGSNAGGNFIIQAMADAGGYLSIPLFITRATQVVKIGTALQLPTYTVATLPTCGTSYTYSYAAVSDATSPTYNGALTGGGSVHVPVFCNGTSWLAH